MQLIDLSKSVPREAEILISTEGMVEVVLKSSGGGVTLEGVPKTDKRYITGFIEILEEHSLPMTVRFFTPDSEQERVYIRFVLLPGIKTRVCFDLTWLDCSQGAPQRTKGTLKQVIYGTRTDISKVERVELGVKEVFHDVHLRFSDFSLTSEKPEEFPLPDVKLVDEFGQWKRKEWPGKIHSKGELREAFHRNEGEAEYPFMEWNKWGGDSKRKIKEGSGFFSTCKTEDGRWHLLDPEGCDYFSVGPCCIRANEMGTITDWKENLEWLPDAEDSRYQEFYRIGTHPWYPEKVEQINYVGTNLYKIYGEQWKEKWREISYHILMKSGINSQGNFPGLDVNNGKSKLPYVREIPGFPTTKIKIFRDFPDVLSPEYLENSIPYAKQLEEWKGDPWLIGYFLRNEPGFNFIPNNLAVANEVLHNPESTYCRMGLIHFLKERYSTVEMLNSVWKTEFISFEELEKPIEDCIAQFPASVADLREYSAYLVSEYSRIPSQACKEVDPDHLNLGLRWSKMNNPDMLAGWEHFDVFSFNCYSFDPLADMNFLQEAGVDLPVMIGEFHCGSLDAGLTTTGLKGVKNQYERGVMWRQFVEKCAAHPYGVGAHWFQFMDEFCLGRFDGENYQIGLVDICMQPYKELMEAVKETSSILYKVKNGEVSPYDQIPEIIPMIG